MNYSGKMCCVFQRMPKNCMYEAYIELLGDSTVAVFCMLLLTFSVPTPPVKSFNIIQVISSFVAVSHLGKKKDIIMKNKSWQT